MARWFTRRVVVLGLSGATVVAGLAVTTGIADASTTQGHKKPHTTTQPHTAHGHAAQSKTFATKRAGVRLHSAANAGRGSQVVSTLGKAGTPVTVTCYTVGETVSHDRIWYRTATPAGAYVSGSDLRSGHDPAAGINRC